MSMHPNLDLVQFSMASEHRSEQIPCCGCLHVLLPRQLAPAGAGLRL